MRTYGVRGRLATDPAVRNLLYLPHQVILKRCSRVMMAMLRPSLPRPHGAAYGVLRTVWSMRAAARYLVEGRHLGSGAVPLALPAQHRGCKRGSVCAPCLRLLADVVHPV